MIITIVLSAGSIYRVTKLLITRYPITRNEQTIMMS